MMKFSDLKDLSEDLARGAGSLGQSWSEPTLRLGVTGLSRAGKTVFITALIHNLVAGGRLLFFDSIASGRVKRVYLEPQPDDTLPRFNYEDHIASLSAEDPTWPQSTKRISQLRLTFEYEPEAFFSRTFGANRLYVDIIDYPGEWLLDLPLLSKSFETWSRETWQMSAEPKRAELAQQWRSFTKTLDPKKPQDEAIAQQASELFKDYLESCRAEGYALSTIPPGRFLMPGDLEGSPALTFAPLFVPADGPAPKAGKGSLWAMMERRYESYKSQVVHPFFRDHFVRLDRQIVLVDMLGALNAGPEAVHDLERALSGILDCFKTGSNSWLSALWRPRIEKIAFCATKADHLHHTSHDRLEAILQRLTKRASARAAYAGADVDVFAIAGIRATQESEAVEGGETWHCIQGVPEKGQRLGADVFDGHEEVAIFPGDLPANPDYALSHGCAESDLDASEGVKFIKFKPPLPKFSSATGLPVFPHIRLDRVLHFVLGDKLP